MVDSQLYFSRFTLENKSQRELLACEILTTEQTYYCGLKILTDIYLATLKDVAKYNKNIENKIIDDIFINLSLITDQHEKLVQRLEERLNVWEEEGKDRLGDILSTIVCLATLGCSILIAHLIRARSEDRTAALAWSLRTA